MELTEETKFTQQLDKNQIIKLFVETNPYPSYEEMEEYLDVSIQLYAEYGVYNHVLCKNVYENLYNEKCDFYVEKWINTVIGTGGGGILTLRCNADTLRRFSPISKCEIPEVLEKFTEIYDFVIHFTK